MKLPISWIIVGIGICLGQLSPGLVYAQSKAAEAPIVLQFLERPIFLGPHEHWVTAIAFSPDWKTLATGANDGYLRLWDSNTGRLKSIHGDDANRAIQGMAFSPDGRFIALTGGLFGREAVIWDTTNGRIAQEFEERPVTVSAGASAPEVAPMIYKGKPIIWHTLNATAFSPDGRILAIAGNDVVLREIPSGKIVGNLKHSSKGVKAIAFTPDGNRLLTAGSEMKVKLWKMPGGVLEATLDGPTQPLGGLAVSPDGQRIVATSSGPRSVLSLNSTPVGYLWSWEKLSGPAQKIEIGSVDVRQITFVGPATVVVAAGRELLSLDLQGDGAKRPRKIWSHSDEVLAVAASPNGRLVASGGKDRSVDIIDVSTGKLVHRLPGLTDIVSSAATSSDGKRFATATLDVRFSNRLPDNAPTFAARYKKYFSEPSNVDRIQRGEVRIWSPIDGRLQTILPLPICQVTAIDFIPQSDQLAVAGWIPGKGGMLSIWDASSGRQLHDFTGLPTEILSLSVSLDGRTLASGDADGNLDLWDVRSGKKLRTHKHDRAVEAVAFSADGKLLATGEAQRIVRLFDASTGAIVRTLHSRSEIESLDFSPDTNWLAAGTQNPGLELWDLRANTDSRILKDPADHFANMPGFVAFSPDSRFVVCGGRGKNIAVFDVPKGTLHSELRGHIHAPTAVAFLPDGRVISGGEERTIRLWDLNLGKYLATWTAMPADPKQNWNDEWIGFKPTGEFIGSTPQNRLTGWQTNGEITNSPEDAKHRRLVESLFPARPYGRFP